MMWVRHPHVVRLTSLELLEVLYGPGPLPVHLLTLGKSLSFSGPQTPCKIGEVGLGAPGSLEEQACFFPEMLPAWQESSLDAHISCWSPCKARGLWGIAPLGDQGMLYGPRVCGPLSLLLLKRVL